MSTERYRTRAPSCTICIRSCRWCFYPKWSHSVALLDCHGQIHMFVGQTVLALVIQIQLPFSEASKRWRTNHTHTTNFKSRNWILPISSKNRSFPSHFGPVSAQFPAKVHISPEATATTRKEILTGGSCPRGAHRGGDLQKILRDFAAHMRTMVLVYQHLHNWVILWQMLVNIPATMEQVSP